MLTNEQCAALEQEWMRIHQPSYINPCGIVNDPCDPYDGEYWLNTKFAKRDDYERLMEWRREMLLRRRHHAVPPPTAGGYLTQIRNTTFTDAVSLSTLINTINNEAHPCIPIGTYEKHVYRLAPSTAALKLYKKDTTTREKCPSCILGLNKNTRTIHPPKSTPAWAHHSSGV